MAYETYYRITYTNEQTELIEILLQKKDGVPGTTIQDYAAEAVSFKNNSQQEGKFAEIISREVEMSFDIRDTDLDYWDDFMLSETDTWRCIITQDTQYIFHGFVLPDEGEVPFQDLPYTATIRATDAIGLLKQKPLTDISGNLFEGEYSIITYILAALKKMNLDLEVIVYDNVYSPQMNDRSVDIAADFFSQAYLDYRTFKKDAIEFVSCYEALEIIFKRTYKLFYWNGKLVIIRLGLFQYIPQDNYYTVYSADGSTATGYIDEENHSGVGKGEIIYPINEDQIKKTKFANKSARTIFNYNIWPEIPKNNKFDRGALIIAYSGINYTAYEVDDWDYGRFDNFLYQTTQLPAVDAMPAGARAYRKSTFNIYGVETLREVILEPPTPPIISGWLVSDGIPVLAGDKIEITYDVKVPAGGTGVLNSAIIFIKTAANDFWFINTNSVLLNPYFSWFNGTAEKYIAKNYVPGDANWSTYETMDIKPTEIPADGTLHIIFVADGNMVTTPVHFKNFQVNYYPFIAGGNSQVKGEYIERTQNANYPDKSEEEVFLNTNRHKVFKGTLLLSDGTPINPTLYRYGLTEERSYMWLTNIAEYNLTYRRFWEIEGSFNSTKYRPANNPTLSFPISFHKRYHFADILSVEKHFMLLTPLDIDLIKGWHKATYAEIMQGPFTSTVQTELLTSFINRVIAAINATTETEWDSASLAPPTGTTAFPPTAALTGPSFPTRMNVGINSADNMTATATDGGQGNFPSITETYNNIVGPGARLHQFTFGTDIQPGNIFTFTAYGHNVVMTVRAVTVTSTADGTQSGDSTTSNFIFE